VCSAPGNDGLCGIAPNGVPVFMKAGNADAAQVYSLGNACPVDVTSTSAASAGAGAVLGGCSLIAIIAVAAWFGIRRTRQGRSQRLDQEMWSGQGAAPHKTFSLDTKVRCPRLPSPIASLFVLKHCLCSLRVGEPRPSGAPVG
jgi:hypothetical protein